MMKTIWMKELTRGIVGLFLLIPASYFLFTLFVRIAFGSTSLYYAVAPSLLDQTFAVFSQAAWILYGPLLALFLNLPAWIKFPESIAVVYGDTLPDHRTFQVFALRIVYIKPCA